MSEQLQISSYHESFHNKLSAKILVDIKKTTVDTFKSKEVYYKTRRSITSTSTTLGTEHVFTINNSYSHVSHFYLEIKGTANQSGEDYIIGKNGAQSCIKKIENEIGSNNLCSYTGDDLVKITHLVNKDNSVRDELAKLAGGGSMGAGIMICPIVTAGSNCIYGLDASDIRTPAFPIGACNSPLTIRITLQSASYISKTIDYAIDSVTLRFFSYAIKNDTVPNIRASSVGSIYYSWNYIKTMSNTYPLTLTDATEHTQTIDNVITQGLLNGIVVDIINVTTQSAAKEYQNTQIIDELSLNVRGTEVLYQHNSNVEGRMLAMQDWKIVNKYNSTDLVVGTSGTAIVPTKGYFYPMALTGRPDISFVNIGTQGLNLNLNKPTLTLKCTTLQNSTTANAQTLRVMAIYKALWNVRSDKSSRVEVYPTI